MISVHVEVLPHLHRTLSAIKSSARKAGVAINPSTPVEALEKSPATSTIVLVMSVNPGFGGQSFIPHSESKIRRGPRAAGRAPAARRRSKWTAASTDNARAAWSRAGATHPGRGRGDLRHARSRSSATRDSAGAGAQAARAPSRS